MALNIDKLARDAQKETKQYDLIKEQVAEKIIEPSGWHILIEPLTPKTTTEGGLIIAKEAQDVEAVQMSVGRVLACGPTAMAGQTSSGIRLCEVTPNITKPSQLIGKHVMYQRYTGQEVKLRRYEKKVVILKVDEILAVIHNPDELQFWI